MSSRDNQEIYADEKQGNQEGGEVMRSRLMSRCAYKRGHSVGVLMRTMAIADIRRCADEKYRAITRGADEKQRVSRGVLMRTRVKRCANL